MLNELGREVQLLMEDRPRHGPESVPSNFRSRVVAKPAQRRVDRHVAHWLPRTTPGEDVFAMARLRMKIAQNCDRLRRERHEVLRLGLGYHIAPFGFIEVDIRPFCLPELARPHEEQRGET